VERKRVKARRNNKKIRVQMETAVD
jgi:hypothetical protein